MSRKLFYPLILLLAFAPLFSYGQDTNAPADQPAAPPIIPTMPAPSAPGMVPTNRFPRQMRQAGHVPGFPTPGAPGATTPRFSPGAQTPVMPTTPGLVPAATAPAAPALTPSMSAGPDSTAVGTSNPSSLASTAAAAAANDQGTYTFNFVGMPLDQVLDEYAKLVNRTLIKATVGTMAIPDPVKTTINLKTKTPLSRAEAIMALETVLGMNGVTVLPMGDKFAKVVTEAAAPQAGSIVNTNDAAHTPDMGRFITQIVQWKYASADDIMKALQPFTKSANSIMAIPSTQTLVLRDYTENVKRMLEMIEKIDVPTPLEIKPQIIPIKYALATDIQQVLGSLGGGGGGVSVGRSMGGGGLGSTGGYRSSAPNSMGYGGGVMNGGQTGMNGSTTGLGAAGGGGARTGFQNNLQKIIAGAARGVAGGDFQLLAQTKIIADERTNSLLVFANDDDMKIITNIIAKLDVVLQQVLIEAIIMEVSLSNNRDIGISYLQHPQTAGSVTTVGGVNNNLGTAGNFYNNATSGGGSNVLGSLPGGFSYLTSINHDLDIVLTAVQGDSRVNVLSRPRIQTSHAVPASLFVGDTVPYITGSMYGGYGYGNTSQYSQKEVGISLEVLPLINPDGLVVMDIRQNIEQIGGYVTIPGAGDVPKTTKRNADAKVAVRDRETIMLGGFISNSKSTTHSGVPWLMDIPLLGNLFRSNSDKHDKVELIVLIRPTVLRSPADAAVFAGEERDKMSGVKKAELDLREDERKRNEQMEAEMRKDAAKRAKKAKAGAKASSQNTPGAVEPVPTWDQAPAAPKDNVMPDQQPVPGSNVK